MRTIHTQWSCLLYFVILINLQLPRAILIVWKGSGSGVLCIMHTPDLKFGSVESCLESWCKQVSQWVCCECDISQLTGSLVLKKQGMPLHAVSSLKLTGTSCYVVYETKLFCVMYTLWMEFIISTWSIVMLISNPPTPLDDMVVHRILSIRQQYLYKGVWCRWNMVQ